jgi:hypothetical protein
MSGRSIAIVLLAMCGSFTTILAFMGFAIGLPKEPRKQHRRPTAIVNPTPPAQRPLVASEVIAGQEDQADISEQFPSVLPPLPEASVRGAVTDPQSVPEVDAMARTARTRLARVEAALARQVASLKESRDQLLDEFAEDLAGMSVDEATQQLSVLDDEMAGMALRRLGPARQKAILRSLPPARRESLQKLLRLASR